MRVATTTCSDGTCPEDSEAVRWASRAKRQGEMHTAAWVEGSRKARRGDENEQEFLAFQEEKTDA